MLCTAATSLKVKAIASIFRSSPPAILFCSIRHSERPASFLGYSGLTLPDFHRLPADYTNTAANLYTSCIYTFLSTFLDDTPVHGGTIYTTAEPSAVTLLDTYGRSTGNAALPPIPAGSGVYAHPHTPIAVI